MHAWLCENPIGVDALTWQERPTPVPGPGQVTMRNTAIGLNFIDTSPFYGRGMSEVLLGIALRGVPRDSYKLCTKLGRYDLQHFDFSAKRVAESIDVSLHRLGTDHLDIILCHDIEFVPMQQIVDETIPALRKAKQAGKVKAIGFSGYPMKIFRFILDQTDVDCVLSYNQYTLQNTRFADETIPWLGARGIGVMNAGPFSARLLTNAPLPAWREEPQIALHRSARLRFDPRFPYGLRDKTALFTAMGLPGPWDDWARDRFLPAPEPTPDRHRYKRASAAVLRLPSAVGLESAGAQPSRHRARMAAICATLIHLDRVTDAPDAALTRRLLDG